MDAKKTMIITGAALAGAGVLASRTLGPKVHALHEHCGSMSAGDDGCASKCGHADETEAAVRDAA